MKELISVILGGGAGTRLAPLTHSRSKPAVPLAGRYRLIDIPISNSINSGLSRIFVLTQFNSASLNRHIQSAYRFDRFSRGFVTILAAEQTPVSKDWFQGTADAVRRSMMHIQVQRHSHVLILSGDQLYSMNYEEMFEHHKDTKAHITIATIPVTAEEASGFGILKTDDEEIITEFHEKPPPDQLDGLESYVDEEMKAAGRNYLASMGIYIFDKEVLRDLLSNKPYMLDFGGEIIPYSISEYRVASFPFTGYWSDIGTIRSFYDANLMLAQQKPPFDMFNPEMPLFTNSRTLPHAKIHRSVIEDSIIAEACVIENSHIINSVIGLRSYIGQNTTIRNTVFMGADYFPWHDAKQRGPQAGPDFPGVGNDSYIEGAIVDKNVSIGKRCRITNKDHIQEAENDKFYIRDGIVVLPKNVVIEDDTII